MDHLLHEQLDVLQADLDDESPQVLAALVEHLLAEGALDAHLTPLLMKKGRPGTRVEVLCKPSDRDRFVRLLLTETSTLGVKVRTVDRYSLHRTTEQVEITGATIRVKVAWLDNRPLRAAPEFEDCRAAAERTARPVREILDEARAAARKLVDKLSGR